MKQLSQLLSQINEKIGTATAWLTVLLMVWVCFDVAMRYIFNNSVAWRTELEWHIFALIFLFGAGYALKHDKHVRVDLFYAKFSEKQKAVVNFLGTLLFLIPWCVVILMASYRYAHNSWLMNEGSPDNGLPARYLIKFAITIGMGLLLLQAISLLINSLLTLFQKPKPPN
ncbi:MAG: TRAP transporter small permease subunit [Bacteroidota bacterium]